MPHRDDREAAHHHIEALERELAETKARAERAEKAVRERDAHLFTERRTDIPRRKPPPPRTATEQEDPRWRGRAPARFRLATMVTVALLDAPVVVLLAGWRWDLDDADAALIPWTLAPLTVLVAAVYALARFCRAPFPSSAMTVSILAHSMGWFALLAGASDMIWGDLLAEPPLRWVTRGVAGVLAVALHALIVSRWAAEAALSEISGD